MLEVETGVETWCGLEGCRSCVEWVRARIGFTPSEVLLHHDLRGGACARGLTLEHELAHVEVMREAQARVLRNAHRSLAWATVDPPGRTAPMGDRKRTQAALIDRVEASLASALAEAVAHADAASARLDHPARHRHDSRRQRALCGRP